jgi:hypothetical protein
MTDNKQNNNYGFTEKEKIEFANDILPLFLNRNFGCVSKEEIELIVFKHFIKATKNTGISDYDISKKLGLTPIKVKNLKVKNYLRFEDAYDLKSKFSKIIDNTPFEIDGKNISFVISDVNLKMEIQNFLNENKFVSEYVLNPNVFKCSIDVFCRMNEMLFGTPENTVFTSLRDYIATTKKTKVPSKYKKVSELIDLADPLLSWSLPTPLYPCFKLIKSIVDKCVIDK